MRQESSTVVALVGRVGGGLPAALAGFPNVSVARQGGGADGASPGGASPGGSESGGAGDRGWQQGARAMRAAARRRSTYVVVLDDPLAGVAAAWQAMWAATGGAQAAARFEAAAAGTLAAWQDRQFELPDYYLVAAPPPDSPGAGPDFYLGPLRSARPRRVAVAAAAAGPAAQAGDAGAAAGLRDALRSLEHGPWWPPLDQLLEGTRRFYAGGLAPAPARAPAG